MTDTQRRVKVYTLNGACQWDDCGTGYVSSICTEDVEGTCLFVRAEEDGTALLESKILLDTAYQKQLETLIVWSESENTDLALSFQEKAGCDEIWEKICEIQGKDPSVVITQEIEENEDDENDLSGGLFDGDADSLQMDLSLSPYVLPACELGRLDEIADLFSVSLPSLVRRDQLAKAIEESNYIVKLLTVFHTCEDLENIEGLHQLHEIMKGIFLLNRSTLFDVLLQEQNIMHVVGCLEYDPGLPKPQKHREYLMHKVAFKEVLPIQNPELRRKIQQTFHLQYIQDVVLPTPSMFDENIISTLSSLIFFNKVEIVNMVQEDDTLLSSIFKQLCEELTSDERRRDLAGFVRELCSLSLTLQPTARDDFFQHLNELGVLSAIEVLFSADDTRCHQLAVDIFSHVVEHSPSMVRDFARHKMVDDNHEDDGDDDDLSLLNLAIEHMICDPDPELSFAIQLTGLLRVLLDPENMITHNNEKDEFLSFFYKHCMHALMAPLLANTADEQQPQKVDYSTAHLLSLILDLITFSVENHTYHVKNYIFNKDLLRRVLVLLFSKHTFLSVCALRFMRKIISTRDEFYNNYIIKGDLFQPVVETLFKSAKRYNLLNSTILETFELIRIEDIKSLIDHIVERHYEKLQTIHYVKTFSRLKLRYDQQKMCENQKLAITDPSDHNQRLQKDAKIIDEKEKWLFENDDDDYEDAFCAEDSSETSKINIDSLLEAEKPEQTALKKPNTNNDNIVVESGHVSNQTGQKMAVKADIKKDPVIGSGLVGLVDYSDDDESDEDDETE